MELENRKPLMMNELLDSIRQASAGELQVIKQHNAEWGFECGKTMSGMTSIREAIAKRENELFARVQHA